MYSFSNFHVDTVANFTLCEMPDRPPDFYSYSGSTYWDLGYGVIRWSNHWGRNIRSCHWYLDLQECRFKYSVCGFCRYDDFRHKWRCYYEEDDCIRSSGIRVGMGKHRI
jgi:hypothetical protein